MQTTPTTKTALARELCIARSSLYYKRKKPPSDARLKTQIMGVMEKNPAYGHKRIAIALNKNRKCIRRVMNIYGLRPRLCRRRRVPTKLDDMGRKEVPIPNILKRLCPIREQVVWAGDFTYIWFQDRFWYVATVIDVYTREIVGWHIANHHTAALIMDAFNDAVHRTGKIPRYFHSDQGAEYVSGRYGDLLTLHAVVPSLSKKSSPWQNGIQESFYNNFKLELENPERFPHIGLLIEAIHGQIAYYNHHRIHTSLAMAPITYRNMHRQKKTATAVRFPILIPAALPVLCTH